MREGTMRIHHKALQEYSATKYKSMITDSDFFNA